MQIETKYDQYQEIWFMKNNKPDRMEILSITTHLEGYYLNGIKGKKQKIYYSNGIDHIEESLAFPNKEKLLESL